MAAFGRTMIVKLRWVTGMLVAVIAVSACTGIDSVTQAQTEPDDPPAFVVSPTTKPSTTTVLSDPQVSSTTVVWVDVADPKRLISADLGVDVVVSTESRTTGIIDPLHGEVIWVPIGDTDPGPGEEGLVLIAGHLNAGEPFYNLVDDSDDDQRNGANDHGLSVGAVIDFELADGTMCRYRVINPLGIGLGNVKQVPDQPAIYFPKASEIMNPILAGLIAETGDRPIVMMWVSYAGPDNDQWRPNGINRANNAVVFSVLDTCNTPTR